MDKFVASIFDFRLKYSHECVLSREVGTAEGRTAEPQKDRAAELQSLRGQSLRGQSGRAAEPQRIRKTEPQG